MAEFNLGPEVRALVGSHLASMDHVDVLLLLHGSDGAVPTAEILRQTGRPDELVHAALADLENGGLIAKTSENGVESYVFRPQSETLSRAVDELVTMYNQKPVTLVRAIYDRPAQPVLSFADAFRLRGDKT